jgi:CheY-like chemotaxis protein
MVFDLVCSQDSYVASRILIVDDSPRFRALAAELLVMRGFEVLDEAADGEQALACVAGCCPDGILLDVNLPGQDGFAVAASLAAACAETRIVLTSADTDCVPAEVMQTCAAIAFVAKAELAGADLAALFSRQPTSGPQVGQHGEDPAMRLGRGMQAELVEDAGHVALDGGHGDH